MSLSRFIDEHREAIESDLITSAGVELKDIGDSLSWGALMSFLKNLNSDSALWRSTHPEVAEWGTVLKTNIILADIFDVLSQINANLCGGFTRKKPQKIKPYPRPWAKNEKRKIGGKGAIPKDQIRDWIKNYKRRN